MEEYLLFLFDKAPLGISFLAGILTFISPCVLPLIPAYLSYISEVSLSELKAYHTLDRRMRFVIVRNALFFVLGMGIVFVLLGVVAARILSGGILLSPYVAYFAGGILIIFGLHTAKVIEISFLNYQKNAKFNVVHFSFLRDFFMPFLLGVSFSLGWTPCVGPILAGIISLASLRADEGIILMIVYTLGFSLPFLLCAFLVGYAFAFLDRIKRYFRLIEWCAGGLLIVIGILIITGKMEWLSNYLVKVLG